MINLKYEPVTMLWTLIRYIYISVNELSLTSIPASTVEKLSCSQECFPALTQPPFSTLLSTSLSTSHGGQAGRQVSKNKGVKGSPPMFFLSFSSSFVKGA